MKVPNQDNREKKVIHVSAEDEGLRIDKFLSLQFQRYSRSFIQKLIAQGLVRLDGREIKPKHKVQASDRITLELPVLEAPDIKAEAIPLDIVYEDEWLVVINKQAQLVVHPSAGHQTGTMVNALMYHFENLSTFHEDPFRPGIVHRLDRDTTGVIVVAKDEFAHYLLAKAFADREIQKEYRAIVHGVVEFDEGIIETKIERNPKHRELMRVSTISGRDSVTYYKVVKRYEQQTQVACFPKTGRTHQIRVHMAHLGHPIVADEGYSPHSCWPAEVAEPVISRQALHARRIEFVHPMTEKPVAFEADIPDDMKALIEWNQTGAS